MNRYFTYCFTIFLILLLTNPEAGLAAGSISRDLKGMLSTLGQNEEVNIIVTFATPPVSAIEPDLTAAKRSTHISRLQEIAARSQLNVKTYLQTVNAKNMRPLWIVNALAARVPVRLIDEIAQLTGVLQVAPDSIVRLPATRTNPSFTGSTWNIDLTGADQFRQSGNDGSGVVVAIIDTGVDLQHQDILSRWRGGSNSWYDPNGEHSTPYDSDGHGTRVSGIILGGDAGGSTIGMAPGARWIGVKIFNDAGEAAYSAIHLGFQWLLDPDNNPFTNDRPDIINNSWGLNDLAGQCFTEFQPDIQLLRASGIAVVFSAGNAGPSARSSISPANNTGSFATGGIDHSLLVTDFSSRGPSACNGEIYPHLMAPAVDIRTSDITFGGVFPDNYAQVNGTSFAAPHVAGAMALLKSGYPWLGSEALLQVLTLSARDLDAPGPDNATGYGLLDLSAAVNLLDTNTCTTPDGSFFFDPNGCDQTFTPGNKHIPAIIHLLLSASFQRVSDWPLLPRRQHFSMLAVFFNNEGNNEHI